MGDAVKEALAKGIDSGRKYHAFLISMVVVTVMLLVGKIGAEHFSDAVEALVWAYIAGNVGERVADSWQERARLQSRRAGEEY